VAAKDRKRPSGPVAVYSTAEINCAVAVHREKTSVTPGTVAENYFRFDAAMMEMRA